MATITGNPLVLTTADVGQTIAQNHLKIAAVLWDEGTSATNDDQVVLTDKNGAIKYAATLHGVSPFTVPFVPYGFFESEGLRVDTLDHGMVLVYLADGSVGLPRG